MTQLPITLEDAPAGALSGAPLLEIAVDGTPVGQGAVRYSSTGHGYHANGKALKPWRRAVQRAAEQVRDAAGGHAFAKRDTLSRACTVCAVLKADHVMTAAPVFAEITVTVKKPKSAPKLRRTWPITRSSYDIDHHARAILDAISAAEVWRDDSQVIELIARKAYPGEGVDALPHPGAVIRIWELS
ncbi:RusA family crossover junction endodeoxyribonuclease [Microtetraspora malaysiensis]|uniref:RusA family crossover junction endodeoxyribonuclease n=1 Tax=Microtetraspora malaysiensis TaxID=161358 RepID=A0ABW6T3T0_9ACTN